MYVVTIHGTVYLTFTLLPDLLPQNSFSSFCEHYSETVHTISIPVYIESRSWSVRRLRRGTTPQPPRTEHGDQTAATYLYPPQEGVRVTWERLRSLRANTTTLPNKKHRHAFCNTAPHDIKHMEDYTAHNHTRQQHNIHSLRDM